MAKQRQTDVNIVYKVDTSQLDKSNQLLKQSSKATDELRKSADQSGKSLEDAAKKGDKSFSGLSSTIKLVGAALTAAFASQVIGAMQRLSSEFQKSSVILQNTFGSRSAAQKALKDIAEFARTTPFQITELTESFVKLANRGVTPTIEEMRGMGDLAAVLGKDFMQLTEAILDVNNPERWKELGIRAETAGNKVKLSFKGMTVEADRNAESVAKAVVQFGQMQGVAGSMAAIAETTGGKMSNLKDNLDQILTIMGNRSSGLTNSFLDFANNILASLNKSLNDQVGLLQKEQSELNVLVGAITDVNIPTEVRKNLIEELNRKYPDFLRNLDVEKVTNEQLKDRLKDVNDQFFRKIALQAAEDKFKETQEEILELIEDEAEARKELNAIMSDPSRFKDNTLGRQQAIKDFKQEISDIQKERESLQGELTQKLTEYNNALKIFDTASNDYFTSTNQSAKATENFTSKLKKHKEELNEIQEMLGYLSDLEMFETENLLKANIDYRKRQVENAERSAKLQAYWADYRAKKEREAEEESMRMAEENAIRKKQLQEDITRATISFSRELLDVLFSQRENETSQIEENYNKQIELAGNNERARNELEIKKARELERARKKEKDEFKRQSIARIAAETAINIAEAFPNFVMMALAASVGALQTLNVRKLNKGVISLQGPGTKTSDSIPAMLSRGESVMTADETTSSRGVLKAVRARKLNDKVLSQILSGKSGGAIINKFDDKGIIQKLDEIKNSQPRIEEHAGIAYKVISKGKDYKQRIRLSVMSK